MSVRGLGFLFLMMVVKLSVAQNFSVHQYEPDSANIPNPERGFYHHTETRSGAYDFLEEATLRSYREQGITMILRMFYIDDYVSQPIDERYLSNMQQDFNTARLAGVKMIVRFAYTQKSTAPYNDATPEWVLKHIAQLKPLLKKNSDVIAVVQAGFIGAWGEWYYTDHFSETLGNPTAEDWVNRRALVNALLDALPEGRSVLVRTPAIKFSLVENTEALTSDEAFSNSAKARIGHHNDCFLASDTDYGTYTENIDAEKAFLEQETNFLAMGGETCGEDIPLSECANALEQMKRFHWSFLNKDYHGGVLSSWEAGSCMPEVFQKLGYRFRLIESSMQTTSKPGGEVKFSFKLINDGWANPYNKRLVEIILRKKSDGKLLKLLTNEDPRRWSLNDTIHFEVTAGIPPQAAQGEYEVLIDLPDPEPTLRQNPAYSIRLANPEVWEATTGFNKLNHTVNITNASEAATYQGVNFFLTNRSAPEPTNILVDGNQNDWSSIDTTVMSGGYLLKIFNNLDSIYFLITGISSESFDIYIDADRIENAGTSVAPWNSFFADYRIDRDGLAYFESGTWHVLGNSNIAKNGNVVEIGVSVDAFDKVLLTQSFDIGLTISDEMVVNLPQGDRAMSYIRFLASPVKLEATSSGEKIIIYWANNSTDAYHVIERSTDGTNFSQRTILSPGEFSFVDNADVSEISYRMYNATENGGQVSAVNESTSVTIKDRPPFYVFAPDGDASEWEGIEPLSTAFYADQTQSYFAFIDAENLNILYKGVFPAHYVFYFDTDNTIATGMAGDEWNYGGFDFFVRNDSLFQAVNSSSEFIQVVSKGVSDNVLEISIPLGLASITNDVTALMTAGIASLDNATLLFPSVNLSPTRLLRVTPAPTPDWITVSNSETLPETQLIIQWAACSTCDGYVVKRSLDGSDFSVVSTKAKFDYIFYDNGLSEGVTYYYKVYGFNEAGLSVPTAVTSGKTHAVVAVERPVQDKIALYPNPIHNVLVIHRSVVDEDVAVGVFNSVGTTVHLTKMGYDQSELQMDFSSLPVGLYILHIDGRYRQSFKVLKQ